MSAAGSATSSRTGSSDGPLCVTSLGTAWNGAVISMISFWTGWSGVMNCATSSQTGCRTAEVLGT